MWFWINLFDDQPSVQAAIVPSKGVYFVASDVARLLSYSNLYIFAKTWAKTEFVDLIPPEMVNSTWNRRFKSLVFSVEEFMFILRRVRNSKSLPNLTDRVEQIIMLWNHGLVPRSKPDPTFNASTAPLVKVRENIGNMTLQEWIDSYGQRVAEQFSRIMNHCSKNEQASNLLLRQISNDGEHSNSGQDGKRFVESVEVRQISNDGESSNCGHKRKRIVESFKVQHISNDGEPINKKQLLESVEVQHISNDGEPINKKQLLESVEVQHISNDGEPINKKQLLESVEVRQISTKEEPSNSEQEKHTSPSMESTGVQPKEEDNTAMESEKSSKILYIEQHYLDEPPSLIYLKLRPDGICYEYLKKENDN